jgi:hypothetical protein
LEGDGLVIEAFEKRLLKKEGSNEKMNIFMKKGGEIE